MHARLLPLLHALHDQRAHALILAEDRPPMLDTGDALVALAQPPWSPADVEALLEGSTLHCVDVDGAGRWSVSAVRGARGWTVCLRPVVAVAPSWDGLELPRRVAAWSGLTHGLLVVASPNGHGKTTTVASLVDAWTASRARRVVMVQQPVEVLHETGMGLVTQLEAGLDDTRWSAALASVNHARAHAVVLDVKMPQHAVRAALALAMAGTLTVLTLDVATVTDVIRVLLMEHPGHAQHGVRRWLQAHLAGVLAQRWKTADRSALEYEWAVQSPVLDEMLRGEVVKELSAAVRPADLPDVAGVFGT